MPEVVEVKKYADFIRKNLLNKNLTQINILKGRYKTHSPFHGYNLLLQNKIIKVDNKGKLLWIELKNNIYITFTLGLSGGFLLIKNKKIKFPKIFSNELFKNEAVDHLNVEFKTQSFSIYFYDTLSYGTIKVYFTKDDFNKKLNKLGPDIMNINFEIFKNQIFKNLNKEIGNVIVNQKLISGIGNYLRSDILWLAKVSPFRLVKKIKPNELKNIFDSAKNLTWNNYNKKSFSKTFKSPSSYGRVFFVYMQDTDIFGNKVIKKELYEGSQKRSVYYVKERQI